MIFVKGFFTPNIVQLAIQAFISTNFTRRNMN